MASELPVSLRSVLVCLLLGQVYGKMSSQRQVVNFFG